MSNPDNKMYSLVEPSYLTEIEMLELEQAAKNLCDKLKSSQLKVLANYIERYTEMHTTVEKQINCFPLI